MGFWKYVLGTPRNYALTIQIPLLYCTVRNNMYSNLFFVRSSPQNLLSSSYFRDPFPSITISFSLNTSSRSSHVIGSEMLRGDI